MVALFVFLTFAVIISINAYLLHKREKLAKAGVAQKNVVTDYPVFSKESILVPQNYYFSKGHTWLKVEKDGSVKIGIDDFLNKVFNQVSVQNLTHNDRSVKKGETLFQLDVNGKKLNILSPLDGKIETLNENVLHNGKIINSNPYEQGWIMMIKPNNLKESLSVLNIGKDVINWMQDEIVKLKDFVTSKIHQPSLVGATMYDGGNFIEGVINYLPDNEINNFEKEFLNIN